MDFLSDFRALWRTWTDGDPSPAQLESALRAGTEAFCAAASRGAQVDCLIALFSGIWCERSEQKFESRWMSWLDLLETDVALRGRFQQAWKAMLSQLNSVSLLAEAGIPGQHGLMREI